MDSPKETYRDVEQETKKKLRDVDGHDVVDDLGNAGDEIRKDLGDTGDEIRRGIERPIDDPDRPMRREDDELTPTPR